MELCSASGLRFADLLEHPRNLVLAALTPILGEDLVPGGAG